MRRTCHAHCPDNALIETRDATLYAAVVEWDTLPANSIFYLSITKQDKSRPARWRCCSEDKMAKANTRRRANTSPQIERFWTHTKHSRLGGRRSTEGRASGVFWTVKLQGKQFMNIFTGFQSRVFWWPGQQSLCTVHFNLSVHISPVLMPGDQTDQSTNIIINFMWNPRCNKIFIIQLQYSKKHNPLPPPLAHTPFRASTSLGARDREKSKENRRKVACDSPNHTPRYLRIGGALARGGGYIYFGGKITEVPPLRKANGVLFFEYNIITFAVAKCNRMAKWPFSFKTFEKNWELGRDLVSGRASVQERKTAVINEWAKESKTWDEKVRVHL